MLAGSAGCWESIEVFCVMLVVGGALKFAV